MHHALDRSAALVLSILYMLQLHWPPPNPANPARNMSGAGLGRIFANGRISDLSEPISGTTLISTGPQIFLQCFDAVRLVPGTV